LKSEDSKGADKWNIQVCSRGGGWEFGLNF